MAEIDPDKGKCRGRERLIRAAQTLATDRPFDEITIEEIIKGAELSRPAFYYHFTGGKEELRAEMVQRGSITDQPGQDKDIRHNILEAAVRIFARSGVPAAALDDIAAEAGVTRGTLCWHFHNKDELIEGIIKQYGPQSIIRPVVEQIEQDLENGIQLDERTICQRLAGAFYDGFAEQGDLTRLAILVIYTHPEAARILAEIGIKGRKKMTEYVKRRQEEGYFRTDIYPGMLIHIMAATFLMRTIGRGLNEFLPFSQLSREEIIDQLVSLLLYGMVRREGAYGRD